MPIAWMVVTAPIKNMKAAPTAPKTTATTLT